MISVLHPTSLDILINHLLTTVRLQLRKRGRPLSEKALRNRVRNTVREAVAKDVLTPGSVLVLDLIHTTDFASLRIELPELSYFAKLCQGHPDLSELRNAELHAGRLLAAYSLAAEQSITADVTGKG